MSLVSAAVEASDGVLAAHILAGAASLVLGAAALAVERPPTYRSRTGMGYVWAVAAVAITAVALVALDEWQLWWLVPLAVLALSLALAGFLAPARRRGPWIRLYAHGQGGAYVALVTALLVVSLPGAAAAAAWIAPTLVGVPLIEWRVKQIKRASRRQELMSANRDAARARIVLLSPGQAKASGAILSRSHANYPSFRYLFPDDRRRARVLRALFTGIARDAARLGSAYGALGPDGELRGVALWLAPGKFPWSPLRQLRGASWMLSVLCAYPGSFRAFMQTGASSARLHPADPHWYLETMGVDPAHQREGLGGQLLAPVLEIADRDEVDCYLETAEPRNAEYYARHGFVVEDPALQQLPDGPAHIAMRRQPTAAPGWETNRDPDERKQPMETAAQIE
jgi:GNAT superfamily N-acetyltransferase